MNYIDNFTSQPAIIEHFSLRKRSEKFNTDSQPQLLGIKNSEATKFIENNSTKKEEILEIEKKLDEAQEKLRKAELLKAKAEQMLKLEKVNEAKKN